MHWSLSLCFSDAVWAGACIAGMLRLWDGGNGDGDGSLKSCGSLNDLGIGPKRQGQGYTDVDNIFYTCVCVGRL